jgi:hypothetical protein
MNIYDMFLNHYNILNDCLLLEKNVKNIVKKVVKKEVDVIIINEPIVEVKNIEKQKKIK